MMNQSNAKLVELSQDNYRSILGQKGIILRGMQSAGPHLRDGG